MDPESSGDRSSLIQRAVDFMAKPYETKRTACNEDGLHLVKNSRKSGSSSSSKKRSRPSSSSSSSQAKKAKSAPPPAKSPKRPTKPKSAKFLYIQDRKDAAKAANPGMDSTALAMKLIAEYKALSLSRRRRRCWRRWRRWATCFSKRGVCGAQNAKHDLKFVF